MEMTMHALDSCKGVDFQFFLEENNRIQRVFPSFLRNNSGGYKHVMYWLRKLRRLGVGQGHFEPK